MANTLTATVQTDRAQVLLHVAFDNGAAALVERTTDGVTWATVRGGDPVPLIGDAATGGEAYLYDTEMPLDVDLTYRATPYNAAGLPSTPVTTATANVPSDGFAWTKDPGRPWANVRTDFRTDIRRCIADSEPAVTMTAFGTETFTVDATMSPVLNRARPADVYGVRKDPNSTATWLSRTRAAYDSLRVLFAWGGPIFLQLPPVYGWDDAYFQPGDVAAARISVNMRLPQRLWDAPLSSVDAPVGPAQGVAGATWCDVGDEYATYADMAASGLTWGDIVGDALGPPPEGTYGAGGYGAGFYGGTAA